MSYQPKQNDTIIMINKIKDTRLEVYRYYDQLIKHIGTADKIFNGELVYPRQLEIHLPGNHIKPCNLHCPHCAGKYFDKSLDRWEMKALDILDQLKGAVPYHIYGGAYTEPLLNPYFMAFLAMTKKHGNHFGIHTSGVLLNMLEENLGFLTELNNLSTDSEDYLSISLDAGSPESWGRTKGTRDIELFYEIIDGIASATAIRSDKPGHAVRVCYLITDKNDSEKDIEYIVKQMKILKVDSLRFSIPFGNYNQAFDKVREYKRNTEIPLNYKYEEILAPYLSQDVNEKPYIFYTGPEFTDIDKFTFTHCAYGYYQITLGADGYIYKCSTTATPTMKFCRLGLVTDDIENFNKMIRRNQDIRWNANICFENGARCNRMGLEINTEYAGYKENL